MTQPEGQRRGDQVFTGRDTFDFGTSRSDMERMMRMRQPFAVTTTDSEDQQPFLATEKGQKWIAGAVFAAYWGAPVIARMKKRQARMRARREQQPDSDQ